MRRIEVMAIVLRGKERRKDRMNWEAPGIMKKSF